MEVTQHKSSFAREWAPILILVAILLISRLPAIFHPMQINLDESQMLAQAMRYQEDFVPWRSVDGTTSGPLNTWYLILFRRLGFSYGYSQVHAVAAITYILIVFTGYLAARRLLGRQYAICGAIAATVWLAVNQGDDFIHYSSELVPCLLINLALVFASRAYRSQLLGAACLGLVPWSKLQATPIALALGFWLVARVFLGDGPKVSFRWSRALGLMAASIVPTGAFLLLIFFGGAWEDFWNSYVTANLYYAGPFSISRILSRLGVIAFSSEMAPWLVVLASVWLLHLWRRGFYLPSGHSAWLDPAILAWLLVAATLFACARPLTNWPHYVILFLPALQLLTAATCRSCFAIAPATAFRVTGLVALTYFITQVKDIQFPVRPPSNPPAEVVQAINEVAPPGAKVHVWGWFPSIYIQRQQAPLTRQTISHYLSTSGPTQQFLRDRYMSDLEKNPPDVFLNTRTNADHFLNCAPLMDFPELSRFVREKYRWSRHLDTLWGPVDIYVRESVSQ